MTSALAAAAAWMTAPVAQSAQRDYGREEMACRPLRAQAAALFLAAGCTTHTAAPLCQALFTEGANAWLAAHRNNDRLAVRFLQSWPRFTAPLSPTTRDAGALTKLHIPDGAAADKILCAAAMHHPGTVREVVLQQPADDFAGARVVPASIIDRCVAAWAPNLVVWSVFASSDELERDTVDALYGGGCPNLEVLAMPLSSAAKARRGRPAKEAVAGDLLHDDIEEIVQLARLVRLIVYTTEESAQLPCRSLARFAPQLRELEFGCGHISLQEFPRATAEGLFLRTVRGQLPSDLRDDINMAADGEAGSGAESPPLFLPELADVPRLSDHDVIVALAACAPNVSHLIVEIPHLTRDSHLQSTYCLAYAMAAANHRHLRRLEFVSTTGVDLLTDANVACLLVSLRRLASLHIGAADHFGASVKFAPAAFSPFIAGGSFPAMRELNVARQGGIRKEGLDHIVRLFPNLRALDVRGCFGLSLNDFAAVMLETNNTTAPSTVTSTCPRRPYHPGLRLRKLRRVVASYRRRVPKALNFIEYHCGNYGTVEAWITASRLPLMET
jgi:hypothetical protein